MEFFGKSFTEAVELLTGEKGAAPPQDSPQFRLPPRSPDNRTARNYLTAARRIDEDVAGFFFASGDIYEDAAHHNAVFVGRDDVYKRQLPHCARCPPRRYQLYCRRQHAAGQAGLPAVSYTHLDVYKRQAKTFQEKLGDDYYPLAAGPLDRMIMMTFYLESKYGEPWVTDSTLNLSLIHI